MPRGWNVVDRETPVLMREYRFPAGLATCCGIGFGSGELAVFSPPGGLDDQAFAELDAHGDVTAIIPPNGYHSLGLSDFARRYPQATLYAAPDAARRIGRKNARLPAFTPIDELRRRVAPDIEILEPPQLRVSDLMVMVRTEGGWIWYVNDVITNLRKLPKPPLLRLAFSIVGTRPGICFNGVFRTFIMRDKKAFARWMHEQLEHRPPVKMVFGHGEHVETPTLCDDLRRLTDATFG